MPHWLDQTAGPEVGLLRGIRPSEAQATAERGRVMFWAGIVGDKLIGPFRVPDGVKLDSQSSVYLLCDNFFAWYKSQSRSFKLKCIFMHDNAPAYVSRRLGSQHNF